MFNGRVSDDPTVERAWDIIKDKDLTEYPSLMELYCLRYQRPVRITESNSSKLFVHK